QVRLLSRPGEPLLCVAPGLDRAALGDEPSLELIHEMANPVGELPVVDVLDKCIKAGPFLLFAVANCLTPALLLGALRLRLRAAPVPFDHLCVLTLEPGHDVVEALLKLPAAVLPLDTC